MENKDLFVCILTCNCDSVVVHFFRDMITDNIYYMVDGSKALCPYLASDGYIYDYESFKFQYNAFIGFTRSRVK